MSGPQGFEHDFFISHASEDQADLVRPLAEALISEGYRVWYSEWALTMGDSLRRSIDHGLSRSRFGIVVLSESFFAKDWPRQELDGLAALEEAGSKRILPIWHGVGRQAVAAFSPTLADRLAIESTCGLDVIVAEIRRATDLVTDNVGPTSGSANDADIAVHLKSLMQRRDARIDLRDLVLGAFEPAIGELSGNTFALTERPSKESIPSAVAMHIDLVLRFARMAAIGGEWASAEQLDDWIRVIQRLANARASADGFRVWNQMRLLPAMVISYSAGLGAIAGRRYGSLWRVLTEPVVKERTEKTAACLALFPFGVVDVDAGRTLPGMDRHYTPTSDYLLELLRGPLQSLFDDPDEFESAFDEFEIWLALAHASCSNRDWVPLGRFAWNYRHSPERSPLSKFSNDTFQNLVLRDGAFGEDTERLKGAVAKLSRFLGDNAGHFL